jgi:hypothetical protein
MSIVFSAMALECEVSFLHHKWVYIDDLGTSPRELSDAELDDRLRRYPTIAAKFEAVARLMHPPGLEDFVASRAELRDTIANGFTSIRLGTLAADFQQQLFWPRNRILHLGYSRFSTGDADRCWTIAVLGLKIFEELDIERRKQVA